MPKSAAQRMQEKTELPPPAEVKIRVTVRTDVGFEYFLELAESVVQGLIDPDVPDAFFEMPVPKDVQSSVKRRFVHTSRFKEIDVHDPFTRSTEEEPAKPEAPKETPKEASLRRSG